jgi:hypothetical protein
MRHRLLPTVAVGVLVAASWAVIVSACEDKNTTSASAVTASTKGGSCCASAAARTADMSACKAHGASATTAMTSRDACSGMLGAVFASSSGKMGSCAGARSASTAGMCPHAGSGSKGAGYDAASAASGHSCSAHASGASAMAHGCDACDDMMTTGEQLRGLGTQIQALPLKNGVMFVYTTDAPTNVRVVQTAMARRNDRLVAIAASGDKATLCSECKTLRGALASGKLKREIVNIEGGCMTIMTSTDPSMVSKLQGLAGLHSARTRI